MKENKINKDIELALKEQEYENYECCFNKSMCDKISKDYFDSVKIEYEFKLKKFIYDFVENNANEIFGSVNRKSIIEISNPIKILCYDGLLWRGIEVGKGIYLLFNTINL